MIGAMTVTFIVMLLTGILKFRELLRPFNIPYDQLPMQQISVIHDRAGVLLIVLIIGHLMLNRRRFRVAFKGNKDVNKNPKKKSFITRSLIVVLAIAVYRTIQSINPRFFSLGISSPLQLSGVEITGYNGENLSSIADFRENSIKGPQYIDIKNYTLNIAGLVDNNLNLTYDQVLNHGIYSKVVTLNCVEGRSVKILWEGVLLKDLLDEAGIKT